MNANYSDSNYSACVCEFLCMCICTYVCVCVSKCAKTSSKTTLQIFIILYMHVISRKEHCTDLRFTGRDHHSVHPLVSSLDVEFKGRQYEQRDDGAIPHTILTQFGTWVLKLLSVGKCNKILAAEVLV